jgi:Flp pilus assembly secretin CpaC
VAGGRLAGFGSLEESWMGVNCRLVNCNSIPRIKESEIGLEVSGEFHLATPLPMKKVYLVDPSIASIVILSPTEARVTGKSKGSTSLSVWDISGKEARFKVKVM